jgi:hypothetical protein
VVQEHSRAHERLDGQQFKKMVHAALLWLRQHQEAINSLNVFPVPDGDTGTNMALTMTSAWKEIENLRENDIGAIAQRVAYGALMGARGNSGVILSQIWRGFAHSLDENHVMDASALALALQQAAQTAYKGVVKPVEGTILTVIREVAEEAELVVEQTDDLVLIFEQLVKRAKAAEARTPAMLPVLRQAGVVDSGGQGLVVILEGMWRQLNGLPVDENGRLSHVVDLTPHAEGEELHVHEVGYGYDVQYIIKSRNLDVDGIRNDIEGMGESTLVVGDSYNVKVHVHVPDPGVPLSYGAKLGSLRDVVVEDMQAQYQEFISGRDTHPVMGPDVDETPAARLAAEEQEIGIVVVAAGEGMEKVFQSLGATLVVRGGQTMNPSTADILEAVEQLPMGKVIILPNNKNVVMASEQAAEMSDKDVAVVPTRSMPQGVSALLALDQQASLDGNVSNMLDAAQEVVSGEVTQAVRNVELNGVDVKEGKAIGLLNGKLVVTADSVDEVVARLLGHADLEDRELVTLYYGEDVSEEEAMELSESLEGPFPDLEFEVIGGGQPHYPYLLSIE